MKIRQGFVSNSSSSSFVCDITGRSEVAYDGESEIEMVTCDFGHSFFYDGYKQVEDWLSSGDKYGDDGEKLNLPSDLCPICNGSAKRVIIDRLKREMVFLNIELKDLK